MNLSRSILKLFGAQNLSNLLGFLGLVVFARELSAFQLGVFFLFQTVIGILSIPADMGLRGALEKRISEGERQSDFLSTTIILKLTPAILTAGGLLVFRDRLNDYIGAEIIGLLIVGLFAEELYRFILSLLRGELQVERTAELLLLKQIGWVGGGVLLVFGFDLGARGLMYSYIAGSLVVLFVGLYLRTTNFGQPSVETARSLIKYAKFDFISGTGSTLYNWLDLAIIGFFLSQEFVGAYETAWRLSASAIVLGVAVRTAIFPQVSAWSADDKIEKIRDTLGKMITVSVFLVIPALIGVVILSEELLLIIFGEEYVIASTALVILMGHRLVQSINQTVGKTLQAIDRPDQAAYAMAVGVIVNLILNVILVQAFGLPGAAIATTTSFAVMAILRYWFLSKHIRIRFETKNIGWCIVSAIGMGVVLYFVRLWLVINSFLILLVIVGLGSVLYFVFVSLSSSLRQNMLSTVDQLRETD